jgi:hypothetical protein
VSRLTADIALAQNFVGSAMTNIWMDLVTCAVYVYVLGSMDLPLTCGVARGVSVLPRLDALVRPALEGHLARGASGHGGVLRRRAGAGRRLSADQELRGGTARGALFLPAARDGCSI